MAIFYILHNLIPLASKKNGLTDGQRNCKLFLLGVTIYVLIYIYLKHIQLSQFIQREWYESLKVGLYIIITADVSVMSFIYKDYYGRSIIHEVKETLDSKLKNESGHVYDKTTHTYKNVNTKAKVKPKLIDNIFVKASDNDMAQHETDTKQRSDITNEEKLDKITNEEEKKIEN